MLLYEDSVRWNLRGFRFLLLLPGMVFALFFVLGWCGVAPFAAHGLLWLSLSMAAWGIVLLLAGMRLHFRLNNQFLNYKLSPLMRNFKQIRLAQIERVDHGSYSPIREFGGWGLRYNLRGTKAAVSIYGSRGVRLHLKNNKQLLLGTPRDKALAVAIENALKQGEAKDKSS